jgi:hypothetical protein
MKKVCKQEVPVEPETQQVLNYKKDLEEIKDLLRTIADKLLELKITGGF